MPYQDLILVIVISNHLLSVYIYWLYQTNQVIDKLSQGVFPLVHLLNPRLSVNLLLFVSNYSQVINLPYQDLILVIDILQLSV